MARILAGLRRLIERRDPELLHAAPLAQERSLGDRVSPRPPRMKDQPEVTAGGDGREGRLEVQVAVARTGYERIARAVERREGDLAGARVADAGQVEVAR